MAGIVRLKTVEVELIAAVRRQTTFPEVPRVLVAGLDVVWAFIRGGALRHGHNVAVYRRLGGEAVELTCGVQVAAPFDDEGEVVCCTTPAGLAATAMHVGPYDRMGATYDVIAACVASNGYHLAGINWEVYGDWQQDPARLETQIFMLLQAR